MAFLHDGFWHCIDTKRDKDNLEEFLKMEENMVKNSKILVAGGTGFIGSNLILN